MGWGRDCSREAAKPRWVCKTELKNDEERWAALGVWVGGLGGVGGRRLWVGQAEAQGGWAWVEELGWRGGQGWQKGVLTGEG